MRRNRMGLVILHRKLAFQHPNFRLAQPGLVRTFEFSFSSLTMPIRFLRHASCLGLVLLYGSCAGDTAIGGANHIPGGKPIMTRGIVTTALLLAFVSGSGGSAQQAGIGYKPAADADSKKTILLKDFQPEPALHAAVHAIQRAKFPVIDVHTHTNDAVGIGDRVDPQEMIARMDSLNLKTIIILTGMWGDKLQTII